MAPMSEDAGPHGTADAGGLGRDLIVADVERRHALVHVDDHAHHAADGKLKIVILP